MPFLEYHLYLDKFTVKQLRCLYQIDDRLSDDKSDIIHYIHDNIWNTEGSIKTYLNRFPLHILHTMFKLEKKMRELKESVVEKTYSLWNTEYALKRLVYEQNLNNFTVEELTKIADLLGIKLVNSKRSKTEKIKQIEEKIGVDVVESIRSGRKYSLEELRNFPGDKVKVFARLSTECGLVMSQNHTVEDYIYRLDSYYNGDNLVNIRCEQGFRYISKMESPLTATYIEIYNYIVKNINENVSNNKLASWLQIDRSVNRWKKLKPVDESQWKQTKWPYIYASKDGELFNFRTGVMYTGNKIGRDYIRVSINNDEYLLHRVLAKTWLPNPNNYPDVDHIDHNPYNNRIDNLRWVPYLENRLNTIIKNKGKIVERISDKGVFIKRYERITEAINDPELIHLKLQKTMIVKCCRGKIKSTKGTHWRYHEEIIIYDVSSDDFMYIGEIEDRIWNYHIKKDGSMIANAKGEKMSTKINKAGYVKISLRDENKHCKSWYFHVIVGKIINGDKISKQFDHFNKTRSDNRPENIEGVPSKENSIRANGILIVKIDVNTRKPVAEFRSGKEAALSVNGNPPTLCRQSLKPLEESFYKSFYWQRRIC